MSSESQLLSSAIQALKLSEPGRWSPTTKSWFSGLDREIQTTILIRDQSQQLCHRLVILLLNSLLEMENGGVELGERVWHTLRELDTLVHPAPGVLWRDGGRAARECVVRLEMKKEEVDREVKCEIGESYQEAGSSRAWEDQGMDCSSSD